MFGGFKIHKLFTIFSILSLALSAWIPIGPYDWEHRIEPPVRENLGMSGARFWTTWQWRTRVELVNDLFPRVSVALTLAVIARESNGDPAATDQTGYGQSIGLMQVVPQTWLPNYEKLIGSTGGTNYDAQIYTGMWMLENIIRQANGNVRYALAAYNCGFDSVDASRCYSWGGYTYADDILINILPVFEAAVDPEVEWRPTPVPTPHW